MEEFNKHCLDCAKTCKQFSFKDSKGIETLKVTCPVKIKAKAPGKYLDKINADKIDIKDLATKLKEHVKTLESMLNENQLMSEDVHRKLMKELYGKKI